MAGLTRAEFIDLLSASVPKGIDYFKKWPVQDIFNGINRVHYTNGENTNVCVVVFHVQLVHNVLQCSILGRSLVAAGAHLGERYDLMEKCHRRSMTGTTRSKKLVAIYAHFPGTDMAAKVVSNYRAAVAESYEECLHNMGNLLVDAARECQEKDITYNIAVSQDLLDRNSPFFSEKFIDIYQEHEESIFLHSSCRAK